MAILGKIRKNPWLLILGIGLPLLAFLVGDAFSQGSVFGNPNELGSINGNPINVQDYNLAYNKLSKDTRLEGASQNLISDQAWNQLLQERIVLNEAEELGIGFTDNQYYQMAGRFFSTINPNLVNQNGQVDTQQTKEFLAQLQAAAQGGNPQATYFFEQWQNFDPKINALRTELVSLVAGGILPTKADLAFSNKLKSTTADINYVMVNYSDYAKANNIEVTDEDIKSYLNQYSKQFKKQPTVNLSYVYFPANPSDADRNKFNKNFNAFLNQQVITNDELGTTDTIPSFANAKNDSTFIMRYSEAGSNFDPNYYTKSQIEQSSNAEIKDAILSNLEKGKVLGPFQSGDVHQLIKISDSKMVTDSVKSSHILISYAGAQGSTTDRTQQEAQQLADSLLGVIKENPSKFNEFASTISDDKVSAKENGSVGWVSRFQQNFSPSFLNYIVNNPKGSIDVVPSEFGFHIIKVDDIKQKMGYRIARLQKQLLPSEETQQNIFDQSSTVAVESKGKSVNDFINSARKAGGEVNSETGLTRFQSQLPGIENTNKESDILSWAFNKETEPGSIQRFETLDGGQIVTYLTNKFSEDEYNLSAYRDIVEPIILQNKVQADIENKVVSNTDINAIAKTLGSPVKTANEISYNNGSLAGLGIEPNVAAAAFGLEKGKTSDAIKGNNGIYYIHVTNKNVPSEVANNDDTDKNAFRSMNASMVQQRLIPSFIDASDLTDKRAEKLVN